MSLSSVNAASRVASQSFEKGGKLEVQDQSAKAFSRSTEERSEDRSFGKISDGAFTRKPGRDEQSMPGSNRRSVEPPRDGSWKRTLGYGGLGTGMMLGGVGGGALGNMLGGGQFKFSGNQQHINLETALGGVPLGAAAGAVVLGGAGYVLGSAIDRVGDYFYPQSQAPQDIEMGQIVRRY